tara:strand:- start:1044 stop:1685 length:642 start_codon:yes stop_codon:yes gene_type:complete
MGMIKNIKLIIGLNGSGKTTLWNAWEKEQSENSVDKKWNIFEDWMRWEGMWNGENAPKGEFTEDDRYEKLIFNLENYNYEFNSVVITCTRFCDNDFLCKSEYYLKTRVPDVKIDRVYFENDKDKAIKNLINRDMDNGGYWTRDSENEAMYVGDHLNESRCVDMIINNIIHSSKNYTIPPYYTPLPIITIDNGRPSTPDEYFQSWKVTENKSRY